MILIDLLYNIHFAPFRNYPERGRWVAIVLLSSFLTFVFFGLCFMILYGIFHFRLFRTLPDIIGGPALLVCFAILCYILNKTYIVKQRDAGKIRFPVLYGILIPILALAGVLFFGLAADNFG
jgi:hypothetical protein